MAYIQGPSLCLIITTHKKTVPVFVRDLIRVHKRMKNMTWTYIWPAQRTLSWHPRWSIIRLLFFFLSYFSVLFFFFCATLSCNLRSNESRFRRSDVDCGEPSDDSGGADELQAKAGRRKQWSVVAGARTKSQIRLAPPATSKIPCCLLSSSLESRRRKIATWASEFTVCRVWGDPPLPRALAHYVSGGINPQQDDLRTPPPR